MLLMIMVMIAVVTVRFASVICVSDGPGGMPRARWVVIMVMVMVVMMPGEGSICSFRTKHDVHFRFVAGHRGSHLRTGIFVFVFRSETVAALLLHSFCGHHTPQLPLSPGQEAAQNEMLEIDHHIPLLFLLGGRRRRGRRRRFCPLRRWRLRTRIACILQRWVRMPLGWTIRWFTRAIRRARRRGQGQGGGRNGSRQRSVDALACVLVDVVVLDVTAIMTVATVVIVVVVVIVDVVAFVVVFVSVVHLPSRFANVTFSVFFARSDSTIVSGGTVQRCRGRMHVVSHCFFCVFVCFVVSRNYKQGGVVRGGPSGSKVVGLVFDIILIEGPASGSKSL